MHGLRITGSAGAWPPDPVGLTAVQSDWRAVRAKQGKRSSLLDASRITQGDRLSLLDAAGVEEGKRVSLLTPLGVAEGQ